MKRSSRKREGDAPKRPTPWLRWILLWFAMLFAFVILGYISSILFDDPAVRAFADAAARVGWWLGAAAVAVLVCDIAYLVVYAIRFGTPDNDDDALAAEGPNPFLNTMPLGYSRFRQFGQRSSYVTTQSLVDGTATFGDRMIVLAIIVFLVSFFLIFVAIALVTLPDLRLAASLWPLIPGIVVGRQLLDGWREYRAAKTKLRASR